MAKFKPGDPKPANSGRKRGKENITTSEARKLFNEILSNSLPKLQDDLDSLKPAERVQAIIKLAEFVIPKLASVDATIDTGPTHFIITDQTEYGLP